MGVFENNIIKKRLGEEPYSILELHSFVQTKQCRTCKKAFESISFYQHSAGVLLAGIDNPQWVYAECYQCHHQYALWKLCREEK